MNRSTTLVALAAAGAGVVALRRLIRRTPVGGGPAETDRWLVLTVNRQQEQIAPHDVWPQPLADLGTSVEIELRPAPGDRGTEIAVRPRLGADSQQIRQIRAALRDTKQLLETGEVLRIEPRPHGQRSATPGGAFIAAVTKRARREGVL